MSASSPSSPASPANKDPATRPLRRGDLVRISEAGVLKSKRLKDRQDALGRISQVIEISDERGTSVQYDVEWVLGGRLHNCDREDLIYTTAEKEGMTDTSNTRRNKRKPTNFMQEVLVQDKAKKRLKEQQTTERKSQAVAQKKKEVKPKKPVVPKKPVAAKKPAAKKAAPAKKKAPPKGSDGGKKAKKQKVIQSVAAAPAPAETSTFILMYERHRREFERCLTRLEEKIDCFQHLWDDAPPEFVETYGEDAKDASSTATDAASSPGDIGATTTAAVTTNVSTQQPAKKNAPDLVPYPSHAPYNWKMIRRRMENGRYVLDRRSKEEDDRFKLFAPYYATLGKRRPRKKTSNKPQKNDQRVLHPHGVHWELFRDDVYAMCDAALERMDEEDREEDDGQRGSLSYAVKKIKETVQQAVERTGTRHAAEMNFADDRHKFALAVEKSNTEAAMQSWRKEPFPERKYERLASDVVCAGLSKVDEKIATYELRTSLPDSFIGLSYRYDDTGQSEAWMKSVVDETGTSKRAKSKKKNASQVDEERRAVLALTADEGVTRAQVAATMQSLLISVQDKVMTEAEVLRQPELRSANWIADKTAAATSESGTETDNGKMQESTSKESDVDQSSSSKLPPEIVEHPVWGIDCYTRRNIQNCLEIEFDSKTVLVFVEKWLLPAINACPDDLGHNISNAARILEGLPFEDSDAGEETSQENQAVDHGKQSKEAWSRTLLGHAMIEKIKTSGPPWLKAVANQLRRAHRALGPDFFRVHPKGHGSVVLSPKLKPNTLVTFYRGELYPSWRWGEKMDAIEITQKRKDLKPALPDFYNMALERPQVDPRGYGLLFVDASRKAGHGSSLSHSCAPTCEVRVAAYNGELCLVMSTLRELEMGEELTFNYNAVTESLNEYRSAVCLCGYGKCRGSFLHFATAECYQQVLNRNSPIATRFASLVKGSMKQVMAQEDDQVLRNHGFLTASFGAISVNRRELEKDGQSDQLVDSLHMVPVWLRTYVADTLRYIEYERRALPIALICENVSSAKETKTKAPPPRPQRPLKEEKEPKLENPFFFFSRTETELLMNLLKKEGVPADTLKGLELRHAMQKVASGYWNALTDEKKQHWKDKVRAEYEKKLKAWRSGKKQADSAKKGKRGRTKPGITDILHSKQMSFQDADAEGVAAMEQRIQQLTQSLSRVGRVLDRHREECLETESKPPDDLSFSPESMRKLAQSPLKVLTDEEVVQWMWNKNDGIVASLFKSVECARCVRSQLLPKLHAIREKHSALAEFGEAATCAIGGNASQISAVSGRRQLNEALLELRSALLSELCEMSKDFRGFRSQQLNDENNSQASLQTSSTEDENLSALCSDAEPVTALSDPVDTAPATVVSDDIETAEYVIHSLLDGIIDQVVEKSSREGDIAKISALPQDSELSKGISKPGNGLGIREEKLSEPSAWLEFYGERFTLHAAADLLLLYAHTSNFFALEQYRTLESTPVEVYARELGNAVPRSAIDAGVAAGSNKPSTVAIGVTPVSEIPFAQESHERKSCGEESESSDKPTQASDFGKQAKKPTLSPDKRSQTDLCAPDDIVAKVSVRYQGDYVLAQLLQWYNAGIGQKPGLPDLMGCTQLPHMSDCWGSELLKASKLKAEKKTTYETKVRPRLVEWLQDPFQRGNPWPQEIRRAFNGDKTHGLKRDFSSDFHPFGSPIIDFLVSGDESNITAVLSELDADDKIAAKKSADGLLSSVDKGRPAQAVSTWVQCENPDCMKWRRIPWHVDADLLPEKFFCKDNIWNKAGSSCDTPGDDWDEADTLVDAAGKVEGSPVRKKDERQLSVNDQSSFKIGTRFDVQRSDKKHFSVAKVVKADFSGSIKRIMFHFQKTSSDRDEWVEFGSPRIAPLHSKVRPNKKQQSKASAETSDKKQAPAAASTVVAVQAETSNSIKNGGKEPAKAKKTQSKPPVADPSDINSFTVGARFDVERTGKDRFYHATVKFFDFSGPVKKIMFHFAKTNEKFDEWVEFGSPRICAFDSKVSIIRKEKQAKKKEKEAFRQQLALDAAKRAMEHSQSQSFPANNAVKSSSYAEEDTAIPLRQVSAEGDGTSETTKSEQACVRSEAHLSGVEALTSLRHYGNYRISSELVVEREPVSVGHHFSSFPSPSDAMRKELSTGLNGFGRISDRHEADTSRAFDSMEQHRSIMTASASGARESVSLLDGRTSMVTQQVAGSMPTRPPDFVTGRNETGSVTVPLANSFGSQSPHTSSIGGGSQILSGLDMLAAVTNQHLFNNSNNNIGGASSSAAMGPSVSVNYAQPPSFLQQQSGGPPHQDEFEALVQRQRMRRLQQLQQLDPAAFLSDGRSSTNQTTSNPPPSNQFRGW